MSNAGVSNVLLIAGILAVAYGLSMWLGPAAAVIWAGLWSILLAISIQMNDM